MTEPSLQLPERVRSMLARPDYRIELDDLLTREVESFRASHESEQFSRTESLVNTDTVQKRLDAYATVMTDLVSAAAVLGRWSERPNAPTLRRLLIRLSAAAGDSTGIAGWVALRWLPFLSALYAAGIAAIASDRHDILATLQLTRRVESRRTDEPSLLVYHAIEASSQAGWDALRTLPSLKQTRVPFSEYMFDYLRPVLANAIGLDVEFEDGFDRFEVLNAVWFASERGDQRSPWAPPGRFAWKYHGVDRGGVFTEIEREARDAQAAWPITASGLFRGSHEHFLGFAKRYREEVLNRLNWY